MIISHQHKFIFIKPRKVAGSSVEVILSKYLGPKDIIPAITEYSSNHDKDKYILVAKNAKGYYDHLLPNEIRKRVGKKIWESYFKFTVARNPWDVVVSSYWWELNKKVSFKDYVKVVNLKGFLDYAKDFKKILKPKSFASFVKTLPSVYITKDYYFHNDGSPIENYYLRFENLEEDFKKICRRFGIPYEKLPSLKSKTRKSKKHYREYYDEETKAIVAEKFKREIEFFKYEF